MHMAIWDEGLGGNLVIASAVVAGVFVLRRVAPLAGAGIGSLLVSGLELFAETEFEMQDGFIGKLAKQAVEQLLQTMPPAGADHGPSDRARAIMHRFERTARDRSNCHGWHDRDKRARYRHHVRKLRDAVAEASHGLAPEKQAYLSEASAVISEDW
jgi:hypothetical protein